MPPDPVIQCHPLHPVYLTMPLYQYIVITYTTPCLPASRLRHTFKRHIFPAWGPSVRPHPLPAPWVGSGRAGVPLLEETVETILAWTLLFLIPQLVSSSGRVNVCPPSLPLATTTSWTGREAPSGLQLVSLGTSLAEWVAATGAGGIPCPCEWLGRSCRSINEKKKNVPC